MRIRVWTKMRKTNEKKDTVTSNKFQRLYTVV